MTKAKAMVDTADVPSILIALLPAPLVTVDMPNVANVDHMNPLLIDRVVPPPSFRTGRHQYKQRPAQAEISTGRDTHRQRAAQAEKSTDINKHRQRSAQAESGRGREHTTEKTEGRINVTSRIDMPNVARSPT